MLDLLSGLNGTELLGILGALVIAYMGLRTSQLKNKAASAESRAKKAESDLALFELFREKADAERRSHSAKERFNADSDGSNDS